MLITLFVVLALIGLFLIIYGEVSAESVFGVIGWFFLFFLSVFVLMNGNLAYVSGSQDNISFTYNGTSVSSVSVVSVNNLVSFDDSNSKWFGRYLAFITFIGFILSLVNIRRSRKQED